MEVINMHVTSVTKVEASSNTNATVGMRGAVMVDSVEKTADITLKVTGANTFDALDSLHPTKLYNVTFEEVTS